MTEIVRGGAERAGAVLFDLDGVLTRRDTLTRLLFCGVARRPWRVLLVLGPLITVVLRGDDLRRRADAVGRITRIVFDGVEPETLCRWCVHVGTYAATSPRWSRAELVAEYRRHQHSDRRLVLVTATESRVARALLGELGLRADVVLASRISTGSKGAALEFYNYGPEKLALLRQAAVPLGEAIFYTDSRSDLPVARAVRRTVLVAPSAATRDAFEQAGLEVEVFVADAPSR